MEEYFRVTEVLYPFSGYDYVPSAILENAAVRGTKVHKICESIVDGYDFDYPEEFEGFIQSFLKWWERGHKVIATERRFFCNDLHITGKVDYIIEGRDGNILVDLKTSSQESKTWMLQGSAYSYLAKKAGIPIHSIMFLKLDKDGGEPRPFIYEEQMDFFIKVLDVYKYFFCSKRKLKKIEGNKNARCQNACAA